MISNNTNKSNNPTINQTQPQPIHTQQTIPSEINLLEKELFNFQLDEQIETNKYLIEYSLSNYDLNTKEIQSKLSQILVKCSGKAFALFGISNKGESIGLVDEDIQKTILVFENICKEMSIFHKLIRFYNGSLGKVVEFAIFDDLSKMNSQFKTEIRIGLFGDKSVGKSTLIGVLVNGILDNGLGLAKSNIYRFQHEQSTGKTSNFSHYVSKPLFIVYLYEIT